MQSIQITASSGLSEAEIEKLIKDAEMNAEDDKKKRALVEARNTADSLIYQTEKSIKELGDKVDAETKSKVDDVVGRLRTAMEGEDTELIKQLSEELTQSSHKLAEAMYQQASQQAGQDAGNPGEEDAGAAQPDDDVVDADFENT